jgi:ubiquitin-protein ligase
MLNCSIDKFNFELLFLFSTKFPLEPPIICLTSYYHSTNNHIFNENGIILYDKISPKYWSSSYKLFEILNDIWNIMNEIKFNNKIIINNMSIDKILLNYTTLIKQKNYI